ncbi:MAG: HAMP domain-containing sensor histidine kinase [Elusimicrobia bacterium]|nr:HAMP domain-containing sensor histidine kinase [Elusimicrobiota bacterium]
MRSKYLLFLRAVLAETLLLHSLYSPDILQAGWWLWVLQAAYPAAAAAVFFVERSRSLPVWGVLASFASDIGMTSLVLRATGGIPGDFFVAYFLIILSTCLIEDIRFSFLIGGVACLVYGSLALPGLDAILQPFYGLRLSLLLTTAFFSTAVADHVRQVQRDTAAGYERKLADLERLSLVGGGLSRILHELKTPLGTISLASEYLRETLRRGRTADLEGQLRLIEDEADRASGIVRDYLDFVRPTELVRLPLAVEEPLAQALAAQELRFRERCISWEAGLAGRTMVLGSARHLVQLFAILFDNAAAAMRLGGRLRVSVRARGGRAEVSIQDNGFGIAPEARSLLFAPFGTTRPETGGTGLGLSIARWIAEKHGGAVSLSSPGAGRGATAVVLLPLAAGAAKS